MLKPLSKALQQIRAQSRLLYLLIAFRVLQPASPEVPNRVRLPQLSRKVIPKNCFRATENIFHKVCIGKKNYSEFAVGVSQRVSGEIATIASFLVTFLDLYVKFPGTRETIRE